jgi:hypothetical protein
MVSPFIFLLGATGIWIILQKDLLLYLGVKLRMNDQDGKSTFRRKFWEISSRLMTKATLYTLQGVLFVLGLATTSSTTLKTCNNIDLVANSFG